jgi:hypothetical protein
VGDDRYSWVTILSFGMYCVCDGGAQLVKKPRAKPVTVTAREVARAAGVSTGTVSRVINAHPAVA